MGDRAEILADALEQLGPLTEPEVSRARRSTIALAARYRRVLRDRDRACSFKDLHEVIRQERKFAEKLSRYIDATNRRLHYALPFMGLDEREAHDLLCDRIVTARNLDEFVSTTKRLEPLWPKGGHVSMHFAAYGNPKDWLAKECYRIMFWSPVKEQIRPGNSAFLTYAERIHELATGVEEVPGLKKYTDRIARWHRTTLKHNRARKIVG